ncbi:MAG: hypothetical protein ACTSUY_02775, partial [Alphaproteobacteria bacterium]
IDFSVDFNEVLRNHAQVLAIILPRLENFTEAAYRGQGCSTASGNPNPALYVAHLEHWSMVVRHFADELRRYGWEIHLARDTAVNLDEDDYW